MIFSQPGFDMKSVPNPLNVQTPIVVSACEKPTPSLTDDFSPSCGSVVGTEPELGNKQEKTVLLNTTMEMTLSNATEIVTVETKTKKKGRSGKLKSTKNKEEASRSSVKNSTQSRMSEVQSDSIDTALQTDDNALEDIRNPEVIDPQSPKILCRSVINSRIPKLSKSEASNNQKALKNKLKSRDRTKSKTESCDNVFLDLDDYFTDPDVKLSPEKDNAKEPVSKITCRRSRTKGRRMSSVTRKTFVTLPSHESESRRSKLEQPHDELEGVVKKGYEACQDQLPKDFPFCADEVTHPEPEHVERLSISGSNMASSGGSRNLRCRGTFVISVTSDGTLSNSVSEMSAVEQDFIPGAGFNCEAGELSTVMDAGVVQQDSESNPQRHSERAFVEDTQSSCKRPWVATQDSGSFQEDLSSSENHGNLLLDQDCSSDTEFQRTKKARREETSQSSKKKAAYMWEEEECGDVLDDKKKKKKRNLDYRSKDESCHVQEPGDVSPLCGIGLGRNKEYSEDLQVVDLHPDKSGKCGIFEHLYDSKPTKSKFRMDLNPKQPRQKSKLHTSTESRNPRETFVVYRRKTQDNVSLNSTRRSYVSDAHSDEGAHQNLGDLLMDEMPPWLAVDVSTADTEVGSLLRSPTRETLGTAAVTKESAALTTETSPGVEFIQTHYMFILWA